MTRIRAFGEGFPPQSVGIVGVSRKEETRAPGYSGLKLFRSLKTSGYAGSLYPINPNTREMDGQNTDPDVVPFPNGWTWSLICSPGRRGTQGTGGLCYGKGPERSDCTSGFGETGTEKGRLLDNTIREIIQRGDFRVLGPNCMGFHIPSARFRMFEELELAPGPVAFISQSGGQARAFLLHGPESGIGFSKAFSYGNALAIDAPDFLDYLANDPETGFICMYLEGIKDGRRLVDLVERVNLEKPVITWKAGLTEPGAKASASHTGSLKGDEQIWNAFFKQTGAIESIRSMNCWTQP